jgi:hypothetical protein
MIKEIRSRRSVRWSLAGALAISWIGISIHGQTQSRVPLSSEPNRPWPAPVQKVPEIQPAFKPEDAIKTIYMAPGYRLDLVASEPLVKDPILMEFDADGRMWVMEMPGFAVDETMRDSRDPVNQLVILEDTNNDGVMDKRTVFLDKLVLPRAFKVLDKGAALVGEPPNLWLARDTNGDGKADAKELLRNDYGTGGNIEHDANGLFWGMDNTIYNSEFTYHVRLKNGNFERVAGLNRGQWGVTQDDAGRIYRDVNTDALFVDILPDRYFLRNPNGAGTRGLYENITSQKDTEIWPIRPTRGVNRGYREEVLRPDGTAYYYQGVSSPLIYRGDRLPKELYGNAFVVDGPTNLVHRLIVKDDGTGKIFAHDAYKKGEFLASTDERFRPVALTPAPDGTFYVVDMYRGVSQDGPIQTDFLAGLHQKASARDAGRSRSNLPCDAQLHEVGQEAVDDQGDASGSGQVSIASQRVVARYCAAVAGSARGSIRCAGPQAARDQVFRLARQAARPMDARRYGGARRGDCYSAPCG